MTVLDTLYFVAFKPFANTNPIAVRRRKLVAKIDEQILLATDKDYTSTQHKWITDADGNQRKVEVAKRVKRWWTASADGKVNLVVRYGSKHVLAELLNRDLSKFNPLAPAPYTSYRNEMSGMADRPLNDFIREQFEQEASPFDRDMLTSIELFEFLKVEKRLRVTREREVANALELIGGKSRKQIPIATVADRATVWILRDHEKYMQMEAGDLGRAYVPFYNDSKRGGKK